MAFKIDGVVSFVHAHLSRISFSNFSTDVKFSLNYINLALGLIIFTSDSEGLKGYGKFCWHWARSPCHVNKFLEVKPRDWKLAWHWGGGGGTGGREEYERREREGREAGEKCETLIILIQQCVTKLLKSRNQNIFDLHLTSSQSLLRLLSKRANENLRLGWKTGMVNPFTVVTS